MRNKLSDLNNHLFAQMEKLSEEGLSGEEITKLKKMGNIATITDQVKTFDDVLSIAGTTMEQLINPSDSPDEAAYKKVKLIAKVLNEGWKPDWTNHSQYKYYPWFTMESGSGLACHVCDTYYSGSSVGSRLCFKTRELAEYAGKQFRDLYNQYMNY